MRVLFAHPDRCRRFNRVLQRAIRENQRSVLLRMHLFAKQEHQNRSFQRMRALMPLRITFRALKDNALVNRSYPAHPAPRSPADVSTGSELPEN